MRYNKLLFLAAASALLVGCKEESLPGVTPAEPGDYVLFSASLSPESRTIYGDETANAIKINWLNGDQISVISPQAMSGRQSGLYNVNIGDATSQNYANSLDMDGTNGVQWGAEDATYSFFSVFPGAAEKLQINGNGAVAEGTIATQQVCYIAADGGLDANNRYQLLPDAGSMKNQFMWAQKGGVKSGETVALSFTPVSTALRLNFEGYKKGESSDAAEISIYSVTLNAPAGTNIAGDFTVSFNADATTAPTIAATGASNSVTVSTLREVAAGSDGRYLTIKAETGTNLNHEGFSVIAILNPMLGANGAGLKVGAGWSIVIDTNAGKYTYNIPDAAAGSNDTLVSGQMQDINIPLFTVGKDLFKFEGSEGSWMSQIPNEVYASEITLPGAWYAWDGSHTGKGTALNRYDQNEGYQESTATVANLFDAGIRAFQVETRVGFTGGTSIFTNLDNSTVVMNGTGNNGSNYYQNATSLTAILDALKTQIQKATSLTEYVVLAINYSDGGSTSLGDDCKKLWISKLSSILSSYTDVVYQGTISANTTLGEIRGKIVVLVNIDNAVEQMTDGTYPKALFAYSDMSWESSSLNSSLVSPMQWAAWPGASNAAAIGSEGLFLNYTLANRTYAVRSNAGSSLRPNYIWNFEPTGTVEIATLAERKSAIETIIANSKSVRASGNHNVWFYVGAGGTLATAKSGDTESGAPSALAGGSNGVQGLNGFLLEKVQNKIDTGEASPLGLVFINQATNQTYSGPALIRAIFEMNNNFYLQRAGSSTETQSPVKSASPNHSSGVYNGGNAF